MAWQLLSLRKHGLRFISLFAARDALCEVLFLRNKEVQGNWCHFTPFLMTSSKLLSGY
jgi:gentisate 1,2-dioxygenase